MEHNKNSSKKDDYNNKCLHKKSQINNITMHLKNFEKKDSVAHTL